MRKAHIIAFVTFKSIFLVAGRCLVLTEVEQAGFVRNRAIRTFEGQFCNGITSLWLITL